MLFQRTWVEFPAPTWRLIVTCNIISRAADMDTVHKHIYINTYKTPIHTYFFKFQKHKKKTRRPGNKEGRLELEKKRGEFMYVKVKNLKFYGTSMCMSICIH